MLDSCLSYNDYDGSNFGARLSAPFVLLAVSAFGSFLPVIANRCPRLRVPPIVFFVTRYIGSGVILATGFIHLLADAHETLSTECLGGPFVVYPMAEGLALIGVFSMFVADVYAHRKAKERANMKLERACCEALMEDLGIAENEIGRLSSRNSSVKKNDFTVASVPNSVTESETEQRPVPYEKTAEAKALHNLYQQILNCFVLEFGIVFHSVFVGLSLAVSGQEFKALYIAICFHQMFEGLGLGTRFAITPWPAERWYVPWLLSLAYSVTTPIAIAIGIGIRHTYSDSSRASLLVTGCFDAVCGGVLIYNSLVELIAYDFLYSSEFDGEGWMKVFGACGLLGVGAAGMAVLGRWA